MQLPETEVIGQAAVREHLQIDTVPIPEHIVRMGPLPTEIAEPLEVVTPLEAVRVTVLETEAHEAIKC